MRDKLEEIIDRLGRFLTGNADYTLQHYQKPDPGQAGIETAAKFVRESYEQFQSSSQGKLLSKYRVELHKRGFQQPFFIIDEGPSRDWSLLPPAKAVFLLNAINDRAYELPQVSFGQEVMRYRRENTALSRAQWDFKKLHPTPLFGPNKLQFEAAYRLIHPFSYLNSSESERYYRDLVNLLSSQFIDTLEPSLFLCAAISDGFTDYLSEQRQPFTDTGKELGCRNLKEEEYALHQEFLSIAGEVTLRGDPGIKILTSPQTRKKDVNIPSSPTPQPPYNAGPSRLLIEGQSED